MTIAEVHPPDREIKMHFDPRLVPSLELHDGGAESCMEAQDSHEC